MEEMYRGSLRVDIEITVFPPRLVHSKIIWRDTDDLQEVTKCLPCMPWGRV